MQTLSIYSEQWQSMQRLSRIKSLHWLMQYDPQTFQALKANRASK